MTKAMDYAEFYKQFMEGLNTHNGGKMDIFTRFRWNQAVLGAYVLTHAYNLWSSNYDKWDTVAAFAVNYVQRVERYIGDDRTKMDVWRQHGELVRDLIIGS